MLPGSPVRLCSSLHRPAPGDFSAGRPSSIEMGFAGSYTLPAQEATGPPGVTGSGCDVHPGGFDDRDDLLRLRLGRDSDFAVLSERIAGCLQRFRDDRHHAHKEQDIFLISAVRS